MPFTDINSQAANTSLKGKLLLGEVINNDDPLHLDRVQVRVPELFDPDIGEVPWCMPAKNPIFGQGATWGMYGVPAVGSIVIVECQDGDDNFPVYRGFAQIKPNVNPEFDTPQKWGFVDPSGNKLVVDMDAQTFIFTHSSGSVLTFDGEQRVQLDCTTIIGNCKDGTLNAEKTATVNTETSTINCTDSTIKCETSTIDCTTSNIKCTTSNVDSQQFNVTAQQASFNCPVNNFAGIVNCASIATGFGGGAGTATIQQCIVENTLTVAGINMNTHTHTAPHGETSGPH